MYVNKEKQDKPCNIQRVSKPFSVFTMSSHNMSGYEHWARNITMVIEKDGVKMTLNSKELQQLVNALPRTVGGRY